MVVVVIIDAMQEEKKLPEKVTAVICLTDPCIIASRNNENK